MITSVSLEKINDVCGMCMVAQVDLSTHWDACITAPRPPLPARPGRRNLEALRSNCLLVLQLIIERDPAIPSA